MAYIKNSSCNKTGYRERDIPALPFITISFLCQVTAQNLAVWKRNFVDGAEY
jgi:hypothetical protein